MFSISRRPKHEQELKSQLKGATNPLVAKQAIERYVAAGHTLDSVQRLVSGSKSLRNTFASEGLLRLHQDREDAAFARPTPAVQQAPAASAYVPPSAPSLQAVATEQRALAAPSKYANDAAYQTFAANLAESGLSPNVVQDLLSEFPLFKTGLRNTDVKIGVAVGGTVSGAVLNDLQKALVAVTAASLAFDHDGPDVFRISADGQTQLRNLPNMNAVREFLQELRTGGTTPVATVTEQRLQEAIDEVVTTRAANATKPREQRQPIKPNTFILLLPGVASKDYALRVGHAAADGSVTINGEPAPANAFVAGAISARNRVNAEGIPTVDNEITKPTLVPLTQIDADIREFAEAEANNQRSTGLNVPAGHVMWEEPDMGTPVAENRQTGEVLVRVPKKLEDTLANTARRLQSERIAQVEFGVAVAQVGHEPGAAAEFSRLDTELPALHGVRDYVAAVSMPEDGEFTAKHIVKIVLAARNQKIAAMDLQEA